MLLMDPPNNDEKVGNQLYIPAVGHEHEKQVYETFDISTEPKLKEVEPLRSGSGNSDVWKITYKTEKEVTRKELVTFQYSLYKKVGFFRCYDCFFNDLDEIQLFVYPTKDNKPSRREIRNKQRAVKHSMEQKRIQFVQGETQKSTFAKPRNEQIASTSLADPLESVTSRLTKLSVNSEDQRYALSRLREERTFDLVRRYLGNLRYSKDVADSAGNTFYTATVALKSSGLPIGSELEELYYKFCTTVINLKRTDVDKDLIICRRQEESSRIIRVQTIREKTNSYMK